MPKALASLFLSFILATQACTVWILAPDSTSTGGFIIHKTRDRSIWRQLKTIMRWLPREEGKYRLLEFADYMFMNEKGLFIFNTNIKNSKDTMKGMERITTTMMKVASSCANLAEAEAFLRALPNSETKPAHTFYIVSDPTGAFMVEISPTSIGIRHIEKGFAVHSNHFYFTEMSHLNNGTIEKYLPSATRLEVSREAIFRRLEEKGALSELDSLEISRYHNDKYPNMCPFRDSTICGADYIPDKEFPSMLGTLLVTPGPPLYAPAMSVPIGIEAIPSGLEKGDLGKLAYEVKDRFPKNEDNLNKFRALETGLRREFLECQEKARGLMRENKADEARKLLEENVARQADSIEALFKQVLEQKIEAVKKEEAIAE